MVNRRKLCLFLIIFIAAVVFIASLRFELYGTKKGGWRYRMKNELSKAIYSKKARYQRLEISTSNIWSFNTYSETVWSAHFDSAYNMQQCLNTRRKIKLVKHPESAPCSLTFNNVFSCHRITNKKPLPNFYLRLNPVEDYRKAHIAFIHVPKSGGTSVEEFIMNQTSLNFIKMRNAHCKEFMGILDRINVNKVLAKGLRPVFLYSKRSYGIHYFFPKESRPFMYMTWMRDPVSRFLSTYYYMKAKRWGGQPLAARYVYRSRNLSEFLRSSKNVQIPDFDNYMVRLLQFGDFPAIDKNFEDSSGASSVNTCRIEEKHYLVAKRNLETMAFIGMTEEFLLSQNMLSEILGVTTTSREVHINANSHSTNISEWEREEIERKAYWDIQLYRDAKEIFKQQKIQYLSKFKENAK